MPSISAQISLYPLLHKRRSPVIDEALKEFRRLGVEVRPGTMSTLVIGSEGSIFAALRRAFRKATRHGKVVMVVTVSNACPVSGARYLKAGPSSGKKEGRTARAGRN
jgi:uncharacterized protein YqgV (UPF0045/DUF77 family)